jgi:peroxiredoxin Q/BCP
MRSLGLLSSLAVLVGVSLITGPAFSASETMPQVGQTAPDFTLPSQDGTNISLKDFRGKYVVLYFYPKDKTAGCTIEAHNFQRDLSKYDQAHAVIVGVSVDTTDSHKEFCAEQSLTFKLLSDTDKKVVEQYGSMMEMRGNKMAARNTFLIDPQGKIVKEWTGVKPQSHSEEVLEALSSLPNK